MFDQGGFHLFHFRVPADDFKYLHIMQIAGTDNGTEALRHFMMRVSPDVVIESAKQIPSPRETENALAELMKKQPDQRILKEGEITMSQAEVDAAKK